MEPSAFCDRLHPPSEDEAAAVLGPDCGLWHDLRRAVAEQHTPLSEQWVFSGTRYGWSLRLAQKKRAVMYLTPCAGFFRASFALGEKAVTAAHEAGLPPAVLSLIDSATRYAEGRAVRLEVRSSADAHAALKIAAIKMAN